MAPRCRREQLDPCPPGSRMGKGPRSRQRRGCGAAVPSHRGSWRAPTPPTFHVSLGTFWKERHPQLLCGKCRAQGALPFCTFSEQPLSPRGQRPMWSCTAALPPGSRGLHITPLPSATRPLQPQPKLLARRPGLKGPPVCPSPSPRPGDTQASASTSPSEATSLQASDALWPPGTGPGCSL